MLNDTPENVIAHIIKIFDESHIFERELDTFYGDSIIESRWLIQSDKNQYQVIVTVYRKLTPRVTIDIFYTSLEASVWDNWADFDPKELFNGELPAKLEQFFVLNAELIKYVR